MKIVENVKQIKNTNTNVKEIRNKDTVLWPGFDDVIGAPGSRRLLAGNMQAGWFGEVPASDFITGDALAKLVGITEGTSQYSNEPWLKFAYEGSVLLVTKKPIRYSINWNNINEANCVYGDRVVEITDKKYKVMLMRGIGADVQPDPKVNTKQPKHYIGKDCQNSMWNKLILPLHVNAPNKWQIPANVDSPTEDWKVGYTDEDLGTTNRNGIKGAYTLCQDYLGVEARYGFYECAARALKSVEYFEKIPHSNSLDYAGWRPCLKLIG